MNYSDPNDADKAINTLNGLKLQTKTIKVSVPILCPSLLSLTLPIIPFFFFLRQGLMRYRGGL